MVRVCVVTGCRTGRREDHKIKKALNIRQASFFKVPKCPYILQEWSMSLSQTLTANNYVCGLHFKDEDIIKEDKIHLYDGTIFVSPRIMYKLKHGAIPILKNPGIAKNNNINQQEEVSEAMIIENEEPLRNANLNLQSSKSLVNDEFLNHETDVTNILVEEEMNTYSHFLDVNSRLSNCEIFSLNVIMENLNNRGVPQNWSWALKPQDEPNVVLYFIDSNLKKLRLEIIINVDLVIMVTVMETGVVICYNHEMSCLSDFWDLLKILEKSQFCSGTSINNNRHSAICDGILVPNAQYKRYRTETRCIACRELRRHLQTSSIKKIGTGKNRCISVKRKQHCQKKRLYRLQNKNKQLQIGLEEVKRVCCSSKRYFREGNRRFT